MRRIMALHNRFQRISCSASRLAIVAAVPGLSRASSRCRTALVPLHSVPCGCLQGRSAARQKAQYARRAPIHDIRKHR